MNPDGFVYNEQLNPNGGDTLEVQIQPIAGESILPNSEALFVDTGSGFQLALLTPNGGPSYTATFPASTCGTGGAFRRGECVLDPR